MNDSDRIAVLTGAAGDIGQAVALRLAATGCTLALTDRPQAVAGLDATLRRCVEAGAGDRSATFAFDVTDRVAVDEAVGEIGSMLGPPSMLFNNAGYQGHFANVLDYDATDLQLVLDVNVVGVFNVLRACARAMKEADRGGAVVNTASMAGVTGAPNMVAYSASKSAVIGLTKSAARDLAPHGIRVNAISPAFIGPGAMWERQVELQAAVDSPYYGTEPSVVAQQMVDQVPLGRYGTTDEVAATVWFLLSEQSSYLTGFNVEISGGI